MLCVVILICTIMAGLDESELTDLNTTLQALDVKPEGSNPEEFKKWVLSYAEKLKKESPSLSSVDESSDTSTLATTSYIPSASAHGLTLPSTKAIPAAHGLAPPIPSTIPSAHGLASPIPYTIPSVYGLVPSIASPSPYAHMPVPSLPTSAHALPSHAPTASAKLPLSGVPKISLFSGENKNDILYDQWRYEVECLQTDGYAENVICLAMRRSLKGSAGRVLMRLGPNASVEEIIHKLDSVYGIVEEKETLLANFYSARQKENEDVSTWGCRLEDLLGKALIQGQINPDDENDMLRNMFWNGMKPTLKDISGHIHDKYTNFDEFRRAMRILEQDIEKRKLESDKQSKPLPSKRATSEKKEEQEELRVIVNRLSTELEEMRKANYGGHQSRRNERGNYTPRYRAPNKYRGSGNKGYRNKGLSKPETSNNTDSDQLPICWRCGQYGHLQIGCRVRVDHMKSDSNLNEHGPSARGRR